MPRYSTGIIALTIVFTTILPLQAAKQILRKQVVMDRSGFGIEAFHLLIPRDWRFSGDVRWDLHRTPPEAVSSFRATSPDGQAVVQQYPLVQLAWTGNPAMQHSFQSAGIETMQPMSAADWLRHYYIPRMAESPQNLRITKTWNLPQMAADHLRMAQYDLQMFQQISPSNTPVNLKTEAAGMRIEYSRNGHGITEEVTANVLYTTVYLAGAAGMTQWSVETVRVLAPSSRFEGLVPTFDAIIRSYGANPAWTASYNRLLAGITGSHAQQSQQEMQRRMRHIGQTLGEIDAMVMKGYTERSRIQDRIYDGYSRAVRGVEHYSAPGIPAGVELPIGFKRAWTDGSQYLVSDDPGYNPNSDKNLPNGNWQPLKKLGH